MGRLISRLESRVGATHDALTLPDGSRALYTQPDALLARFLEAGTTEGMPGLCRALVGSRSGG